MVEWILFEDFSQIYVENEEQRAQQNDSKHEFGHKGDSKTAPAKI